MCPHRRGNRKIKAPSHSLLGGFQPKPYHNYKCENALILVNNVLHGPKVLSKDKY